MKNLIKTLVCAVLVLSVSSCRSNDDKFVENIKPVQNSGRIESTPNKLNYINIAKEEDNSKSEKTFKYRLYSIIKGFSANGSPTDKIVRVDYKISFKYAYSGIEQIFIHEYTENLNPKVTAIKFNDTVNFNSLPLQTGGKRVDSFSEGKILVTITTESGAKYSNYLENVTLHLYQ